MVQPPAEGRQATGFASFRVAVSYTDAELDSYLRAVWLRQERLAWPPWGLWTILLGAVTGLVGNLLAEALHATPARTGTVLLITYAGYWVGFWAEGARLAWSHRRWRTALREEQRAASLRTEIRASVHGVVVRRASSRAFYAWRAMTEVVEMDGLVLLFTEPSHAVAIPSRLLTYDQYAQLFARVEPE